MKSPNEMLYRAMQFVLSAKTYQQMPPDLGSEVAIIGRSNSGKSSVLNTIAHQKKLARTSKTPGRTQLINVFALDENKRIIDLPGYGFASVSPEISDAWKRNIDAYFRNRESLKGLLMVMDIRHPLTPLDRDWLQWASLAGTPVHILLNKQDKLSRGASLTVLNQVKKELPAIDENITVQLFSTFSHDGLSELYAQLKTWLSKK